MYNIFNIMLKNKYVKYKSKYLELKHGGTVKSLQQLAAEQVPFNSIDEIIANIPEELTINEQLIINEPINKIIQYKNLVFENIDQVEFFIRNNIWI